MKSKTRKPAKRTYSQYDSVEALMKGEGVSKEVQDKVKELEEPDDPIFIRCDCYSHALMVQYDKEFGDLQLSFWCYGIHGNKIPFFQRFRWMWKILISGLPYSDEVILDKRKTKELKEFLDNLPA